MSQDNGQQAGWRPVDYFKLISIGKTRYYALPEDKKARSLRLGPRTVVIIEPPAEYLARLASAQSETA
jgi:hypothetical protein